MAALDPCPTRRLPPMPLMLASMLLAGVMLLADVLLLAGVFALALLCLL